jgi:glycosyltransferase involved in cell wall biosynthesis
VIVPAADARALAGAMASLLADPERCRLMGAAGRERVLERFTWEQHARGLEALYGDVLRRRTAAQRTEGGALSASAS